MVGEVAQHTARSLALEKHQHMTHSSDLTSLAVEGVDQQEAQAVG